VPTDVPRELAEIKVELIALRQSVGGGAPDP
jgi:hypothetical protein